MGRAAALVAMAALLLAGAAGVAPASEIVGPLPANDLQPLLGLTGGITPAFVVVQHNPEPVLRAVPPARCGPGSRPLQGIQGRVTQADVASPAAVRGWTCNVSLVGHQETPGGFRTWRYVDPAGHVCAFYDTSLPSPGGVFSAAVGPTPGVAVLDMSHPRRPLLTARLTSLAMLVPHESLNLNARRGLLAAEMGNGATLPGIMAIYDVRQDCRHPVLDWAGRAARFGHESGFSRDGRTFWVAGGEGIAAVDVSDPHHPVTLGDYDEYAHGLNVSDDGDRLYVADPINGQLAILDSSEVQARKPSPMLREVSRLTWDTVSIPQNTAPMTIGGHRYLLEFDEFAFRFSAIGQPDTVGGARIIDISDEAHPRVVSNLRLAVNQPAQHAAADGDPSPLPAPLTNYASHYCAIPREVDPQIVACSFINSGLRVFDIRHPRNPREVAYYVSPPAPAQVAGAERSDFAMSMPAFVPARREVWYTDATTGFYALRLARSVWPHPTRRG